MAETKRQKLVPYESVTPDFEGVYTGERSSSPAEETEIITVRAPVIRLFHVPLPG